MIYLELSCKGEVLQRLVAIGPFTSPTGQAPLHCTLPLRKEKGPKKHQRIRRLNMIELYNTIRPTLIYIDQFPLLVQKWELFYAARCQDIVHTEEVVTSGSTPPARFGSTLANWRIGQLNCS